MSLRQILLILLARRWLMLFTVVSTMAVTTIVTMLLPPRYTATAGILIDFKALDPVLGSVLPAVLLPGYLATQLDILSSHNVALKAVDSLKLAQSPGAKEQFEAATGGEGTIRDWLADLLLRDIKLDPSRESSMVNINFRSVDPQFAAAVANAFVQAYVHLSLELKVEPARQTTVFFNEQLQVLKANLDTAQKKLSAYQRENGISATDERFDVENARLAELSTQVVGAQTQTFDSQSRRRQVNETVARGGSADELTDVLNNAVIQALKNQLTLAEAKLGDLSGRVGANHPQYKSSVAEIDELKRKLAEEMKVVTRSINATSSMAASREGSLKGALSAQRARVLDVKKQRDAATLLIREAENAQKAYDAAMARFTQTRLESQNNQTNVAVINPAIVPTKPSFPKWPLVIALAFVVGFMLAIGLALVAEMLDRTARCDEDLMEALDVPVLGWLPAEQGRRRTLGSIPLLSRLAGPRPAAEA